MNRLLTHVEEHLVILNRRYRVKIGIRYLTGMEPDHPHYGKRYFDVSVSPKDGRYWGSDPLNEAIDGWYLHLSGLHLAPLITQASWLLCR